MRSPLPLCMTLPLVHGAAAIAAILLLTGCSVTPTRFYTLAVPSGAISTTANVVPTNITIDVPAVAVPERLARPQMVVRGQHTRVDILEQDRWSSSFNYELRDAFSSGLASRLGAFNVTRTGRPADAVGYRIAIDLRDFDAALGEQVQVLFGWTITRSDDGSSSSCQLAVTEPVSAGIDAMIAGIQRAIAQTADAITLDVAALAAHSKSGCKGR